MLAFIVPLGFEAVAADEIEQVLGHFGTVLKDTPHDSRPWASSGTEQRESLAQGKATFGIVRFFPARTDQKESRPLWSSLFRQVLRLSSIESAVIVLGEYVVPRECWESQSAEGLQRWLTNVGRGEFESKGEWEEYLEVWKTAYRVSRSETEINAESGTYSDTFEENKIKFRATVHRQAHKPKSAMTSTDMSGALGFGVGEKTLWDVSLQAFDLEVVGIIQVSKPCSANAGKVVQSGMGSKERKIDDTGDMDNFQDIEERRLIFGFSVPRTDEIRKRNRTVFGKTSLRPAVAYCLVRSALNDFDMKEGCIVLDPCCGAATIPIEAGLNFPKATVFAGDVVPRAIHEQAYVNVVNSKAPVDLFLWDARGLPFRDGTIDVVVSDLPWGQREGSFRMNCKLYPKLLKCLLRAMKPGGLAHLITGDTKLLRRAVTNISKNHPLVGFDIVEEREVRIGFTVMYFVLKRR